MQADFAQTVTNEKDILYVHNVAYIHTNIQQIL